MRNFREITSHLSFPICKNIIIIVGDFQNSYEDKDSPYRVLGLWPGAYNYPSININYFSGGTCQYVGSSFPEKELNPLPLHWKCRVLTPGMPGSS